MAKADEPLSPGKSLQRGFAILRTLAEAGGEGAKLIRIAEASGLTQATVHRLLQALVAEGMVEQDGRSRVYRLGIDFFALAARAGNPCNLRDLCRPVLQRLSAMLGDTVFLLVRTGFDALCLDRSEGLFPIRSHTGDIGGRVPLGVGQGALVILAFLPEAEREEVIRFNVPRLVGQGVMDEVYLRTEMAKTRAAGYATRRDFILPGMGGAAVPILDREGRAVAALSIGTISERLGEDRLPTVIEILKREADAIGPRVNPFDPALRRPAQLLGSAPRG